MDGKCTREEGSEKADFHYSIPFFLFKIIFLLKYLPRSSAKRTVSFPSLVIKSHSAARQQHSAGSNSIPTTTLSLSFFLSLALFLANFSILLTLLMISISTLISITHPDRSIRAPLVRFSLEVTYVRLIPHCNQSRIYHTEYHLNVRVYLAETFSRGSYYSRFFRREFPTSSASVAVSCIILNPSPTFSWTVTSRMSVGKTGGLSLMS